MSFHGESKASSYLKSCDGELSDISLAKAIGFEHVLICTTITARRVLTYISLHSAVGKQTGKIDISRKASQITISHLRRFCAASCSVESSLNKFVTS